MFSINSIIETLSNPDGRFKTFQGISLDGICEPLFNSAQSEVSFAVRWHADRYVLKCFLPYSSIEPKTLYAIVDYLTSHYSPYWVEYRYREEEMLVFDDAGQSHYLNVVLMEQPPGQHLLEVLSVACDCRNIREINRLLKEFCKMALWLLEQPVVHLKIKPTNVWITPDGGLKLINYEAMRLLSTDQDDPDPFVNVDVVSIANIALGLKLLSCEPSMFRVLHGNSLFRLPVLRSGLLPHITEAAEKAGCEPMREIAMMLEESHHVPFTREALACALEELSEDYTPVRISIPQYVDSDSEDSKNLEHLEVQDVARSNNFLRYDWVNPLSDGYYCVSQDNLWGYLNSDTEEVILPQFDWADDFKGGRAVVQQGHDCGVIDKAGEEVLPICYEWIEWDAISGLMKASLNGKCGLYDRNGVRVVMHTYDWIGEIVDVDLILVRKKGKFGYLFHNGKVAIPLQFEDAFSFCQGVARVSRDGKNYFEINTRGEKISI